MANNSLPKKRKLKDPISFRDKLAQKDVPSSNKTSKFKKFKSKIGEPFQKITKIKAIKPLFIAMHLIGLVIYPKYIRNSFKELKDVTWPKFGDSLKLTYAVIIFAVIFGAAVALVDLGLGKIFKVILLK